MALPHVKHPFVTFPVLSHEGLILRRVVPSDAPTIQEISYYDGVPAATPEEAVVMLQQIEQDYARGDSVHWGICRRGVDEVVGTCGFYRGYPGNVGEIGYVLREEYRGRGIMTAALRRVIAFGFEEIRLHGIDAYTDPANAASIGVLKRLGFGEVPSAEGELKFSLRHASDGPVSCHE
jgi:ribosomal-protein-alanine N-acetyltransferase